jgi:hypothetical protein
MKIYILSVNDDRPQIEATQIIPALPLPKTVGQQQILL